MDFIENAVQKHINSETKTDLDISLEEQALARKDLENKQNSFRRMIALVIAITVHNIPEGLAVGVGFGGANFSQAHS